MTAKHPPGEPMTLGNMRELGLQQLVTVVYEAGEIEWDAQGWYRPKNGGELTPSLLSQVIPQRATNVWREVTSPARQPMRLRSGTLRFAAMGCYNEEITRQL
jgi:hypothetical protein